MFIVGFILILLTVGALVFFNSRRQSKLLNQISVLMDTNPHSFVVTDLHGKILFKNAEFINNFPHITSQIEDVIPFIDSKLGRDSLYQYLKSIIKEESFETIINISQQDKTTKPYSVSGERKNDLILWTLIDENLLKLDYLFYGNRFQKSLDAKYLFNHSPTGNVILDQNGCIQGYNQNFKKFVVNRDIAIGTPFIDLLSSASKVDLSFDLVRVLNNHKMNIPLEFEFKEGEVALSYFSKLEFPDCGNDEINKGYYLQLFDNNEHRKFQQRLSQSQKLQALGQLAGGIAHDFNNLLTAMMGHCDLLLLRHSPGDQSFTEMMQIKQNATRATNLVKQLLAFSRKQTLQPTVMDVCDTLADLSTMLQRLIGSSIDLKIVYGHDLDCIKADRGQFEQVITNLVVNARDAIKESGIIRIITSNRKIEQPTPIGHEVIQPGNYVQIEVLDDGDGIDMKNINRIFDPFFTTKDHGSGTGLGLSTVYGIIKQTGGYITVESTLNLGTKFTILIPKVDRIDKASVVNAQDIGTEQAFRDLTGSGAILLVEDEDAVRMFAARALSDKGYTVKEAHNGHEALMHLRGIKKVEDIPQLLITDVIMPKMDGPQLAKEALKLYPHLKVIYMSGYAEDAFRTQISQDEQIQFLPKPFSLKSLAIKVREAFDEIESRTPQKAIPINSEEEPLLRAS
jgi:two-component system cell cycle sensor histidine kinase/response regulator CckA